MASVHPPPRPADICPTCGGSGHAAPAVRAKLREVPALPRHLAAALEPALQEYVRSHAMPSSHRVLYDRCVPARLASGCPRATSLARAGECGGQQPQQMQGQGDVTADTDAMEAQAATGG